MTTNPTAVYDEVIEAFRGFSNTPRFTLLRDVPLGRFIIDDSAGSSALNEMTFGVLMEKLSRKEGIGSWCTPSQANELLQVLLALSDDPAVEKGEEGSTNWCENSPFENQRSAGAPKQEESACVNSVQLEGDLRGALSALSSHPKFSLVAGRILGEFWDTSWTPAPFEEALTIKQLTSLDISVLFKKKMVSEERMLNVTTALGRVLGLLNQAGSSDQGEYSKARSRRVVAQQPMKPLDRELLLDPSPISLCVYETLLRARQECSYPQAAQLIEELLESCSPSECIAIVSDETISPALTQVIGRIVRNCIEPHILGILTTLLQGPAVRVDHIASILATEAREPTAISRVVGTVIARGIGATQVRYQGKVYQGFWTLHPSLLASLIEEEARAARGNRSQSSPESSKVVRVNLDPFLQNLLQAHGRAAVIRKGRHKGLKSRGRSGK
jgi:hypothetical protein